MNDITTHKNPASDADLIPTKNDYDVIQSMAALPPLEYDRVRSTVATELKIQLKTLDAQVKSAKQNKVINKSNPVSDPEPWPQSIDPDELLNEIFNTILRFIACKSETALAATLWIAMTWFIDVINIAPLVVITAPQKRCGKSQLLSLMHCLVKRPMIASNISAPSLFRTIDAFTPTLLIDEADTFMRKDEELIGILNNGHTKNLAYTIRLVGPDFEPKSFSVWGAKAIAGIGVLADTLMDRSIKLELRRRLPEEKIDRIREADPELFHTLTAKLARFAEDYSEEVRSSKPSLPDSLNDRQQDNWEPLLAIAALAGDNMLRSANQAALRLSESIIAECNDELELLSDIQQALGGKDRISTEDLIKHLCSNNEKPWATYNRGNKINPTQIVKILKPFGISSTTIRTGAATKKGYLLDQLSDTFARYLPNIEVTP